jgi:hypothetical protein
MGQCYSSSGNPSRDPRAEDQIVTFIRNTRFSPLARYFSGIVFKDLARFTADYLQQLTTEEHRLLMDTFTAELLQPFLDGHPLADSPPSLGVIAGELNLSDNVIATKYADIALDRIPMNNLVSSLQDQDLSHIRKINVSSANVFDEDLVHIASLLELCPECEILDLSNNRIRGAIANPVILKMLTFPSLKYLDISVNAFASIERRDFFSNLTQVEFTKLIWIPNEWLSANGWHVLVRDDGLRVVVEAAHRDYYTAQRFTVTSRHTVSQPHIDRTWSLPASACWIGEPSDRSTAKSNGRMSGSIPARQFRLLQPMFSKSSSSSARF